MSRNATDVSRRDLAAALALGAAVAGGAPARAAPSSRRAPVETPADLIVETRQGKVRGYRSGEVAVFKGLNYGADTGGENRFAPPRPPVAWSGVRWAITYGFVCPQARRTPSGPAADFLMPNDEGLQGEDCLRLNIWTMARAAGAKRPVMVWIHGGQFSAGSSQALAAQDGENLCRRGDVVVVSLNHRLNALGYLNLADAGVDPEQAHPNAGMLDLVAALRWISENIAAFGGDPSNVTLFGQSGGGLKIGTLMAMPAAKGLFHKAIIQSGSQPRLFRPEDTARVAHAFLKALGLDGRDVAALKALPMPQLLAAEAAARTSLVRFPLAGQALWSTVGWAPSLDGASLPRDPFDGAPAVDAPLLIGSTRHEFSPAVFRPAAADITEADLEASLRASYGARASEILRLFRARHPAEPPPLLSAIISSAGFNRANAVAQARLKAQAGGAPAWLYLFDWRTPVLDGRPGAYHGSELPFVFHNAERCATATGGGAAALRLADLMADTWLAFARTGRPTHAGLPTWPSVSASAPATMILNETCRVAVDEDREEILAVA